MAISALSQLGAIAFDASRAASELLRVASSASSGFAAQHAHSGNSAVNIDLDFSFTLQMVLFAGLIVVLKPLLFDPVLRVFEERENRTDGAKTAAREMQEKAGELLQRYEQELSRVSRAAAEERDKVRAETARLENEMLNTARASTAKLLEQGRKDIQSQVDKIRFDLGRDAERLARDIATRALGREVH
jgi:F-type H+-transporting ATPase subunit b